MKLAITALAVSAILIIIGWYITLWDRARCYNMPPGEFCKQVELIQRGFTEEDAIAKIKGYTNLRREGNLTYIVMRSKRSGWTFAAVPIWIRLELDENRRVLEISHGDG